MSLFVLEQLQKNESLFRQKRILVIGDIALDRTFLCQKAQPGYHARHASETIYDVQPRGDDYGTVGSSNNTPLFCASLGADSLLITVAGTDPEGERVEEILRLNGVKHRLLRLEGVQTVTRFRFFEFLPETGQYRFNIRIDKEPDYALSCRKAEEQVEQIELLDWFENEARISDVILFNDTDKGFLSQKILGALNERIRKAAHFRSAHGLLPGIIVADPKTEWEKYRVVHVDVFKPNHVEACKAVGMEEMDFGDDGNLMVLARRLQSQFGNSFPRIVVTLGRHGAALIEQSDSSASVYRFPGIPPQASSFDVATHCGDMFTSALSLALSVDAGIASAIAFANCAGSLQYAKLTREKITKADFLDPANIAHIHREYLPHSLLAVIDNIKP